MTKTREEYEAEIRKLHHTIKEYGNMEGVQEFKDKLKRRLDEWYKRSDIYITVAQNEQTPWTEEELGFKTQPMFLKKDIGIDQTGDYAIFVNGTDKPLQECFSSLLVERKGCTHESDSRGGLTMIGCDLYQTCMNKAGRERFYREVSRFHSDPRFTQMIVICECTYEQFLQFTPKFTGKKFNRNHTGATIASRVATINGLFERGVSVRFMGSRKRAIEAYHNMVRLNVIGCYERFIEL